jgi:hypothetical protein
MPVLTAYFSGVVTIAAENRPAFFGLERHLGAFITLSAGSGEHFTFRMKTRLDVSVITAAYLARLPLLTAGWTALGGIGITLRMKSFLLFNAENKLGTAIKTTDRYFLQTHGRPPHLIL